MMPYQTTEKQQDDDDKARDLCQQLAAAYGGFFEQHAAFDTDTLKNVSISAIKNLGVIGAREQVLEQINKLDFIVDPSVFGIYDQCDLFEKKSEADKQALKKMYRVMAPVVSYYVKLLQCLSHQTIDASIKDKLVLIKALVIELSRAVKANKYDGEMSLTFSVLKHCVEVFEQKHAVDQKIEELEKGWFVSSAHALKELKLYMSVIFAEQLRLLNQFVEPLKQKNFWGKRQSFDQSKAADLELFGSLMRSICENIANCDKAKLLETIKSEVVKSPLFQSRRQGCLSEYKINISLNYFRQLVIAKFYVGVPVDRAFEEAVSSMNKELCGGSQKFIAAGLLMEWIKQIEAGEISNIDVLKFFMKKATADYEKYSLVQGEQRIASATAAVSNTLWQAAQTIGGVAFFAGQVALDVGGKAVEVAKDAGVIALDVAEHAVSETGLALTKTVGNL